MSRHIDTFLVIENDLLFHFVYTSAIYPVRKVKVVCRSSSYEISPKYKFDITNFLNNGSSHDMICPKCYSRLTDEEQSGFSSELKKRCESDALKLFNIRKEERLERRRLRYREQVEIKVLNAQEAHRTSKPNDECRPMVKPCDVVQVLDIGTGITTTYYFIQSVLRRYEKSFEDYDLIPDNLPKNISVLRSCSPLGSKICSRLVGDEFSVYVNEEMLRYCILTAGDKFKVFRHQGG